MASKGGDAGNILSVSRTSCVPEKRVIYYRTMAAKALRLAQLASDEAQKASYLDIAARWNFLAAETERRTTSQDEKPDSCSESQSNGDGQ